MEQAYVYTVVRGKPVDIGCGVFKRSFMVMMNDEVVVASWSEQAVYDCPHRCKKQAVALAKALNLENRGV